MSKDRIYPFQDHTLPLEDRVKDLISHLTLEEKVGLMCQYQAEVARLGVKPYKHGTEAAHGVAWLGEATGYPQPIGLGCTWDTELMKRVGSAIGDEARGFFKRNPAINGLTLWAPTVDLERDPRWGRTEEAYGEDPVLAGKLAAALTQGIQGDHPFYLKAVATLKHFIANNNEDGRGDKSVSLDPRNKREYYLKAFEIPFKEGGALSMMTSYNAVNGVPANLNPDVVNIVKREWGMDGFVVSDAFDVTGTVRDHHYVDTYKEAMARSIKEGGIDSITEDSQVVKHAIHEALSDGLLDENDLVTALRNTFRVRFRLGEFDPAEENPYETIDESIILHPDHAKLSREAAQKAMVLLKNTGKLLPLQANKLKKVAVIGPLSHMVYRDWYSGSLPYSVTPLEGLKEKLEEVGGGAQVLPSRGTNQIRLKSKGTGRYVQLKEGAEPSLVASALTAEAGEVLEATDWGWGCHTLIAERNGLYLTTDDKVVKATSTQIWEWFTKEVFMIQPVAGTADGTVTIQTWNGTPITLHPDTGELMVGDGQAAETANEINVAGAAEVKEPGDPAASIAEWFELELVTDGIADAAEAAGAADVAVVFVGNHPLINGKETMDRPDITLAASQEKLIQAVHTANPNTIVVVVGSYPFALNWAEGHIPSILYTSHAGQELGRAVADILFGEVNPAGRLNMTWYPSIDQLPDFMDYDIIKSGRTYQYYEGEVLYPFGHGLSYTTFGYDSLTLEIDRAVVGVHSEVVVNCRVTNTGERAGEEVVQLYVRANQSRVKRPKLQLAQFTRIPLQPGESADVQLILPLKELAHWDVTRERFCIESGSYTIMVGASSSDLRQEAQLLVEGESIPPRNLQQITRAMNYDDYEGIYMDECQEGGSAVAVTAEAGWLAYLDADLGAGVRTLEFRAATFDEAELEIRLSSPEGSVVGRCSIPAGSMQEWRSYTCDITEAAGRQDVYLILRGEVSLSWFKFQ